MAEMKATLSVDSEPVRAVLSEAADAMSAAARDIGILLAQIDALQEATGEALEAEDAALVSHIRQAWSGFKASQEHDDPTYLDFITPDEVFDKGQDAVASWQAAKRANIMNTPQPPATHVKPVGYVTLAELNQLKGGVSCVDLFGEVVPKEFKMIPLYEHPADAFALQVEASKHAADAETVRRERDDLIIEADRLRAITLDLQKGYSAATEALKPFAEVADRFDGMPVSAILPQQCWFTPYSLRQARAALAATEGLHNG